MAARRQLAKWGAPASGADTPGLRPVPLATGEIGARGGGAYYGRPVAPGADGKPRHPDGRRTIQEVARLAGVSHPTVSRALAGHRDISPETVERVRQAALAVGYRPNLFAQALKRGQSPMIGILAQAVTAPFIAMVLSAFEARARESGLACILCDGASSRDAATRALDFLLALPLRAVLLVGEAASRDDATTDVLWRASQNGTRIVAISASVRGSSIPEINVDHHQVGYIATQHLLSTGHRRIAYVGRGPYSRGASAQNAARRRGYQHALADAGIARDGQLIEQMRHPTREAAHDLLDRLMSVPDRATAVVAFNDMRALAIIGAALDRGMRVPADLAVVGVDNLAVGALCSPPLTSVEQPVEAMVSAALMAVLAPEGQSIGQLVQPHLVLRGSSAAGR
jgi:LacI family transcriptional regulator